MTREQIYYNLFLMIIFLWLVGFFSTRRGEGNFKILIPGWVSRLLFIKKVKNEIMIQSLLWQIWIYVMTISIIIGYKLRLLGSLYQVMHLYFRLTVLTALVYLIIVLPDAIVYLKRHKKKIF